MFRWIYAITIKEERRVRNQPPHVQVRPIAAVIRVSGPRRDALLNVSLFWLSPHLSQGIPIMRFIFRVHIIQRWSSQTTLCGAIKATDFYGACRFGTSVLEGRNDQSGSDSVISLRPQFRVGSRSDGNCEKSQLNGVPLFWLFKLLSWNKKIPYALSPKSIFVRLVPKSKCTSCLNM